jgi:hypothetical protein
LTNDRGQSGSSRGRWIRLAVAGVLFAGLAGWLLPETGLPIAVGFALAAFALVGWPLFRAALDPLLDLVRAVRPLVLPLIVIVAGGTIESPPLVQLLVTCLAAIVGWRLAIAPERERAWQVLVNAEWTPARFGPKSTGTAHPHSAGALDRPRQDRLLRSRLAGKQSDPQIAGGMLRLAGSPLTG